MGSILLSRKSGITYIHVFSKLIRNAESHEPVTNAILYPNTWYIWEKEGPKRVFLILWWHQGYYINALYYLLAPILTAIKPFWPLTIDYCRNGQLYFLFKSFYSIFLGNVLFLKTLRSPWPLIIVKSWIRAIYGGCSLVLDLSGWIWPPHNHNIQ